MKKSLLILSFIEGGAVMCAELCGARLMAPVFGSSLYVWASVMGITLGALAAGYFAGGTVRETKQFKALRNILIIASIYLALMPLIATLVLPRLSLFSFTPATLVAATILLLPPVFCLGAASPLFIGLQVSEAASAGRVSGTVYAVSTAGGILSTFLCGFYLIPDLGLTVTLLANGALLLAATMIVLRGKWLAPSVIVVALSVLHSESTTAAGVIYRADGVHGRIEVRDLAEDGLYRRRLLLNGIIQSEINRGTAASTMKYVALLDSLVPDAARGQRALVLGAGGGSAANLLASKGFSVTAVEFDKRIIDISRRYFSVDSNVQLVHEDARRFINDDEGIYQIVLADVFRAEEQPSHVLTVESLRRLKLMLADGAQLYVNWHGYTENKEGEGTRILLNTFSAAGFMTELVFTASDPDYRNTIIIATAGLRRSSTLLLTNTDDQPRLEKYNAHANRRWRQNYLNYYNRTLSHD